MPAADDWVTDGSLPAEETLARFAALIPEPTVGPPLEPRTYEREWTAAIRTMPAAVKVSGEHEPSAA